MKWGGLFVVCDFCMCWLYFGMLDWILEIENC